MIDKEIRWKLENLHSPENGALEKYLILSSLFHLLNLIIIYIIIIMKIIIIMNIIIMIIILIIINIVTIMIIIIIMIIIRYCQYGIIEVRLLIYHLVNMLFSYSSSFLSSSPFLLSYHRKQYQPRKVKKKSLAKQKTKWMFVSD